MFEGKKVLVTGGAGFIGSHIVERLLKEGATVTVLDNFRTGLRENLDKVKNDITLIEGSILEPADVAKAAKGQDLISHQAAQLEITRAIDDPVEDLITNTAGTLNVMKAAVEAGIPKVVMASSAGVYGQAVETPQNEDTHPTNPNWAYGVSKLATEKYAKIFEEAHGLKVTALRYGIVYGPREWYGRVLTIFLKRALENQPLVIFGDGNQLRDFVNVQDVVDMNMRCLTQAAADNQVFNVATAHGTDINTLAELAKKVSGKDIEIIHEDVKEGEASKYYDRIRLPQELKTLVQSYDKANKLLGWEPTIDLEKGMQEEYQWLEQNPTRWQKMNY
ncbi:MAG TPA: SDR family NAD(P)-dependent oxidoreductase [Candidatus Saccharimonadales bacterium]|nr:SDR family NAD(P)-dependent oxidoreductase [Candidatus Saccharimonadales bacterium]